MKRTTAFALFSLIVFSTVCYSAIPKEKNTLRILFVGNSYTYFGNMPHLVSIISEGTPVKLITRKSVIGGASLSEHWRGARGLTTRDMISKGKFDIVVLQEYSLGAINSPDSLKYYVSLFCDLIRKSKAEPYLYLTWPRDTAPQNQEVISRVYREAAAENKAGIVPVGEAWALAENEKPGIGLYDSDGSHPSKLGSFLTACVFAEAFSKQLPRELPTVYNITDSDGESVMLMYINPEEADFFRKVAAEIIYNK